MITRETIEALIPTDFNEASRVWIFQSNRPFSEKEIKEIDMQLEHFYLQWTAHQQPVKGWAKVLFERFIVVMADEEASNMVSGCSTDGMVRVMKSIERQYSVNLFDRLILNFIIKDKIQALPYQQLAYALDNNYVNGQTLYFNNVVENKAQLLESWLIPLENSWLVDRFPQLTPQ